MPTKPRKQGYGGGGGTESEMSSNLWVGNLPLDVTESDLTKLFEKYGVISGITCYASRTYAFVYYKRVQDAAASRNALQGFLINGNSIKIEFAKLATPSKHVWVGGFGSSVTKERLEEELSRFGKIEEFKFTRDRNNALVEFTRLEDASAAVKSLNGLQIGVDRLRVDFLRSRKEYSDFPDLGSAQFRGMGGLDPSWIHPNIMNNFPEATYSGHERLQPSQSFGGYKADQPSKVLWVGYPPSLVIDEEMLHNAMILFGEIERIKCFPSRHCSFVEFRSVEEARRAKEALQGRLFNDPRISLMFSNSGIPPGNDFTPPYPGYRGQRPDMFVNEIPFRPPLMDMFPPSNRFPGPLLPNSVLGPGMPRPFRPRGGSAPLLPFPDYSDPSMLSSMSDSITYTPSGLNQRKWSPSTAGLLPTPAIPSRTSYKASGWDVLDPNQFPRDPKRSRIDGPTSFNDPNLATGKGDDSIVRVDQPYGGGPTDVGLVKVHAADEDYIWRGVIAKGGTPVCHARCIPIGKGLECELPKVVNCSARTGLDMLTKHYAGAIGFDIVFFLPDSEDDFANYTEFLRYLGSKDRAGVAKLDDGTTLFLVPPSDFLTDVLKVAGPERLYGLVLKLPHVHQPLPPIQHMDRQLPPPTHDYVAPEKELGVQMDYGVAVPDETILPPKAPFPTGPVGPVSQAQSNDGISSTSQPGVALTPELIASLTSLLPANVQPSVAQSAQPPLNSSTRGNEKGAFCQGWCQQPQVLDQFGNQMYSNAQVTNTSQSFSSNLNVSMPIQNPAYNLQQEGSVTLRPPNIHPTALQSQPFVPPTQVSEPYSFENTHYGMVHGTPNVGSYGVPDIQQPNVHVSYSNQFHGANLSSRPESVLPGSTGSMNTEPMNQLNQGERSQLVPSQGTPDVEVDKNQRYQSTLQFAASLLFQIQQQQQQQQGSSHTGNQQ